MNYLEYYFKSKGRHGTHSPFVYGFVEEVLRKKHTIKKEWESKHYSRKSLQFLRKSIIYVRPEMVLIPQIELSFLKEEIETSFPETFISSDVNNRNQCGFSETLFLVLDNSDISNLKIFELIETLDFKSILIYLFNIHSSLNLYEKWKEILNHPTFKMTIDFWDAGIMMKKDDFIIKQHFIMK